MAKIRLSKLVSTRYKRLNNKTQLTDKQRWAHERNTKMLLNPKDYTRDELDGY